MVFIGLGRVGSALAVLLARSGCQVVALCDRDLAAAAKIESMMVGDRPLVTDDPVAAAAEAEVVFITTQDRYISVVCRQLAKAKIFSSRYLVVHCSGLLTSTALISAAEQQAKVCSLHPLQSFADFAAALRILPGAYFCFEGDPEAYGQVAEFVDFLSGHLWRINSADKPLYHAAAVVASNFFIALQSMAIAMMRKLNVEEKDAIEMLLPLISGSLENLATSGPVAALTGPIVRGDNVSIAKHMEILADKMPEYLPAYKILALLNLQLANQQSGVTLADFPVLQNEE